jgi:tripartite-type tricarboxylate transporter receptor subunit TctC
MKSKIASVSRRCLLASAFALGAAAAPAMAADWPTRPITLVVPFAAGGTTDILARVLGQKMSVALGQPVVIDNRAGAGGTLGAGLVARAAPDGYTVFMATVAHAMAPGLYKNLSYDFARDLDPVGLVATTPNVLLVHPLVPARNIAELIAFIKAHPGEVNYGSAGPGSTEHLSGELFRSRLGVPMTHVPYKGGAPMMADLVAGQIQMAIETSPSAAQHVQSGKVRALGITSLQRSALYPGVPTLDESGLKGYEVLTWFALMAPHGTPEPVMKRLASELRRSLEQPDVRRRFEELGVTAGELDAAQLAGFIRSETVKWTQVARDSGARID